MSDHTAGPWRAIALGGCSTVVSQAKPGRNDTRIPGYGYRDAEHCLGYPFIEDDGRIRLDFVCFSHDDARLIAAAPDMLEALRGAEEWLSGWASAEPYISVIRAAIAKAAPHRPCEQEA